ncbi:hypothetical protein ACFQ4M_09780 [Thauera mechernichensis]|uniref:Secreted protein n=1 Tax=Thauera mechernichensis TaxID=82788 RepID=A0ABW3WF12_9RHOO|nr:MULTISPECIES: hypothetical protein [Thauera]ENO81367.1 hypothetical protein B447_08438 [Thauera sp. 27]MDG3064979.1 hypothetical protein [Thauera mechernichensis]WBL66005.1 hypothetical protein LQF09_09440 [Thauera sp. WB-2]
MSLDFPRKPLHLILAGLLSGLAGLAVAHNPVCVCVPDGDTVVCTGGFSDGSKAPGVTIDVVAYDETILIQGKLGDDSTLRFKRPEGEFYVLFDAGPGHVVEIDHTEIR